MENTFKAKEPEITVKPIVIRSPKQLTKVRTYELLSLSKKDAYYDDAEKLIGRTFECIIADLENGETMELSEVVGDPIDIADEGLSRYFNFMPNYKIRVIEKLNS